MWICDCSTTSRKLPLRDRLRGREMPLPVVPLPADDEWLGYGLARVGREYCMSIGHPLRGLELHPAERSRPSWVHILEWTEEQWSHLAA